MKKNVLFAFFALMGIMLASCSSDSDDLSNSSEVSEISMAEDVDGSVAEFFNSEIGYGKWVSPGFFGFREGDEIRRSIDSFCEVVNSRGEFAKLYGGKRELPTIDFSTKTLVIGQKHEWGIGYEVKNQKLTEQKNNYVLELFTEEPPFILNALDAMAYWGVFPKLKNKPVVVKVNLKDGEWKFPDTFVPGQ